MSELGSVFLITHIANLIEVVLLHTFFCVTLAIKLWKLLKKELDHSDQTQLTQSAAGSNKSGTPP
jgi:hypothetical protein